MNTQEHLRRKYCLKIFEPTEAQELAWLREVQALSRQGIEIEEAGHTAAKKHFSTYHQGPLTKGATDTLVAIIAHIENKPKK